MSTFLPQYSPSLNSTGTYNLASPYSSLISPTKLYTCTATQTIKGAVAAGIDVLNTVYLNNGDIETNYNTDLANNVMLITISSGNGDSITFPNSALLAVPNTTGVIYRNLVLSISLSALPDDFDTTGLQTEVSDLIHSLIGVKSKTYVSQIGGSTVFSSGADTAIRASRQRAITRPTSTYYQNQLLQNQISSLLTKIQELENYIITKIPPN